MLLSEVRGHKVVSTSTAQTVGHIADLVIDPPRGRVVAITLKRAGRANTVPWEDITAFGADAVTVPDETVAVDSNETE